MSQSIPAKGKTPVTPSSSRHAALRALTHAIDKARPLDEFWSHDRHFQDLSPSDRAFAQLLAKTVLRRMGQIDALLAGLMEKPLVPRASKVLHLLRLGVAQLMFLETPPHAAVHTAVDMTRQIRMEKYGGFVNAILQRAVREGKPIVAAQDAALLNTPPWLWERWCGAYGEAAARAIAHMHMSDPPLDLSVKCDPKQWARTLGGTALPNGSVRLAEARGITALPGFAGGQWWVQDMAASLPALALGDVKGKRVLDLCAAPGGKTAQLAAAGALVIAVDQSRQRVSTLKSNIKRLNLDVKIVVSDALAWQPDHAPDAILLDAPCSATGTLRRHPDTGLHRAPRDIERLVKIQHRLLKRAIEWLNPGGVLVYSVCSLEAEEGERQIARLLKEHKNVSLSPIRSDEIGGLAACLTRKGELRTLPCHLAEMGGMDGFYAARLVKRD